MIRATPIGDNSQPRDGPLVIVSYRAAIVVPA